MAENPAFGIDLGSTNASIAYVDALGRAAVIPNALGELTTPSVVYMEGPSDAVVGRAARNAQAEQPQSCVAGVKTALGKSGWSFTCFNRSYRAQEIAAMILRQLAADAQTETGRVVSDVVIACPGFFGQNEIAATRQAAELAGLNVLGVIPEATAAAYAFGVNQTADQTLLVFDLGGHTCDASLVQTAASELNVLTSAGDDKLGGHNWDEALARHLAEQFATQTGLPAAQVETLATSETLLRAAEDAKIALSRQTQVSVPVRQGESSADVVVTRETFEGLTAGPLAQAVALAKSISERAGELGQRRVDKLLMVGGATYMPQVRAALEAAFPFEVVSYKPSQAVAEGCAVYAHSLRLNREFEAWFTRRGLNANTAPEQMRLEAWREVVSGADRQSELALGALQRRIHGVAAHSFGLLAYDNHRGKMAVTNLLLKDSRLPVLATGSFATHEYGQPNAILKIYQSQQMFEPSVTYDPELCDPDEPIGEIVLSFPQTLPKGSPIEVQFELNREGALEVRARDVTTDTAVKAEFRTETIMDEEEIAAQQAEAQAAAQAETPVLAPDALLTHTVRGLDELAAAVRQRQPETAAQLHNLSETISGDSMNAWSGSDPTHSFDMDTLTAGIYPGLSRFTFMAELIRNSLLFAPIIFTWYAIWRAMEAYHAATVADASLKSQPFLLLWQQGFGGHLHGPSLAEAGRTNAFLVAGLLVLTFLAQIGNAMVDRATARARAKAAAVLLDASRCLGRLQPVQAVVGAVRPARRRESAAALERGAIAIATPLSNGASGDHAAPPSEGALQEAVDLEPAG